MVELITIEELEKEIKAKEGEIKEIEIDIGGLEVIKDNTIIVNTLQVAEIFEKRHDNVISKVKDIIKKHPELLGDLTFKEAEYIDNQGKKRPMYEMGRDGFSILGNKFTGDKALDFTVKYVRAFGKMVDLLQEISLLNSKKETLLLEEEKNELSNKLQKYTDIYGEALVPKTLGYYYQLPCHLYSENYMYKPITINGKAVTVKTQGYKNWINKIKPMLEKLPQYIKDNNVNLEKPLYLCIVTTAVEKIDVQNLQKAIIDQISEILGVDDNIFTSHCIIKLCTVDSYEEGKTLLYIRNDNIKLI